MRIDKTHFDSLHVNVSSVRDPLGGDETRTQNRRVVEVLHSTVVGVLHRDLSVHLEGVLVALFVPGSHELLELGADLREALLLSRGERSGVLRGRRGLLGAPEKTSTRRRLLQQSLALLEEFVDSATFLLVLVGLGAGAHVGPDDAVVQRRNRCSSIPLWGGQVGWQTRKRWRMNED